MPRARADRGEVRDSAAFRGTTVRLLASLLAVALPEMWSPATGASE